MVSRDFLLRTLPPFNNISQLINNNQEVHDIIKEVVEAHKYFSKDYDLIYQYFDGGTIKEICKRLFDFLKNNINYQVETEDYQTTKSPAATLATMEGDCKHYAGFIAGVLSAIVRNTNRKINWYYRFGSYSMYNDQMEHVFVVVNDRGKEIWIDPVLKYFDSREVVPFRVLNKKINENMLNRISGLGLIEGNILNPDVTTLETVPFGSSYLQTNAQTTSVNIPLPGITPDLSLPELPPNIENDIKILLYYGIMDSNMNISNDKFIETLEGLSGQDATELSDAYGEFLEAVSSSSIGGSIWSSIWGFAKQVSLAIPRGAYLSMVSLNVFNLAGHLNKCITNINGTPDQHGIDRLQGIWHVRLRGDTNILLRAIRNGAPKKAILGIDENMYLQTIGCNSGNNSLGCVPGPAFAACVGVWAAAASTIIVAMTPLIKSILQGKNQYDGLTAQQLAMQPTSNVPGTSTDLQKYLPFILLGGVAYYLSKK
jgi:hypothetical protein